MALHRFALLVLLVAPICAFAPVSASGKEPQLTPLVAEVPSPPIPMPASDEWRHLVYELGLANAIGGNADIRTIDVLDHAPLTLTRMSPPQRHRNVLPLGLMGVEFSQ